MKNLVFVAFFLLMVGEAHAAENISGTATTTPPVAENVSPEAIFDQIRGFLTLPTNNKLPTISTPTPEVPNFDVSGVRNWNGQIRDIAGVDILQFLRFILNVFLAVIQYILNLIPRTAG